MISCYKTLSKKQQAFVEQRERELVIDMEHIILNKEIKEREVQYFPDNGVDYRIWLIILTAPNNSDLFEYHVKTRNPLEPALVEDFYYYPKNHNTYRITSYSKYKSKIL